MKVAGLIALGAVLIGLGIVCQVYEDKACAARGGHRASLYGLSMDRHNRSTRTDVCLSADGRILE